MQKYYFFLTFANKSSKIVHRALSTINQFLPTPYLSFNVSWHVFFFFFELFERRVNET